MEFLEKDDYYGIAEKFPALVLKGSRENKSASVYEAKNERGDVVQRVVYGEQRAPSCSFEVKDDLVLPLKIGTVNALDSHKFCFGSIGIRTTLGAAPTVEVTGRQVADGATTEKSTTVDFGYVKISRFHDAQIPSFGAAASGPFTPAFTLGTGAGTDFFLNDSSIDCAADISDASVTGRCLNHDVQNGRCSVQGTIVQIGDTVPTIVPGEGWEITAPLTKSSEDESQPTWTFTIVKSFASVHPAE